MPQFQSPQQYGLQQPRPPARTSQPARQARNDRYLPPMPDMLRSGEATPPAPPRYAQNGPKSQSAGDASKGLLMRAQNGEEKSAMPAKLLMPTPEELGVVSGTSAKTPPVAVDWTLARQRLDTLGSSYYRLEKAAEGGFRFICSLPHAADANRERHFESHAASEAEAIRLALQQVEEWHAGQR